MGSIYDDGKFVIAEGTFSTPNRIYPLAHATARLRHDALWLSLSAAALSVASIAIYGDLLTSRETMVIAAIPIILLALGLNVGILALDAPGHQRTIVFTGARRARKIFNALRRAKLAEIGHSLPTTGSAEDFGK